MLFDNPESLGALVLYPSYQQSAYVNGDVKRFSLGSEYYPPSINAWFTPNLGFVRDQFGEETFSYGFGAHWQLTDFNRIGASYSFAPETENLITTNTKAWRVYLRTQFAENYIVTLNYSQLNRENSYTRSNINISLQYIF